MGKIVYIIGKSASGKDTLYKKLLLQDAIQFKTLPLYTTRPIRDGEKDGVEYFFTDENGFQKLKEQEKILEERTYHTVHGIWHYFTVKDEGLKALADNYLMIGTLESYLMTREWMGKENILPIFIDLDDGERLGRAVMRERCQEKPQYEELCRRFLADAKDFSEENIKEAGIQKKFWNWNLMKCYEDILEYLKENL